MQYGKQPEQTNDNYNPHAESAPPPYNPFDQTNEFVQNDFGL
jgi:hypothetical protein